MHKVLKPPVFHPILGESLFLIFLLSGVLRIKKWDTQYKDEERGKNLEQNQLNRPKMGQFETRGCLFVSLTYDYYRAPE